MRIKEAFEAGSIETARAIVRSHPFATIVTRGLQATHMPCLLDELGDGLVLLGHVAYADPASRELDGPLLLIFHGPHGYVSASWYEEETIPTWNHVTLHVRGTPRLFADAMPVLRRTVDHFEAAVEHPWSLDRLGETAPEMADEVVAFRLVAADWHAELKLSQDKPGDARRRCARTNGVGSAMRFRSTWEVAGCSSGSASVPRCSPREPSSAGPARPAAQPRKAPNRRRMRSMAS